MTINVVNVSIIVPAYNESDYIEACLTSLLSIDYPKERLEIIVVDNGSSDDTVEKARSFPVKVVEKTSGKVGSVRNYGVGQSSGEVIAFIDSDCVANKDWLKASLIKLSSDTVGAVGGACMLRENPNWVESAWIINSFPREGVANILAGSSMIMSRETFLSAGKFDEKINAGEDTKLSEAIKDLGLSLEWISEAAVIHLGYPRTVLSFSKREFWQASSFLQSNTGFLKDKTFVLITVYLISLLIFPFSLFMSGVLPVVLVGFLLLIPLLFSLKRIYRYKVRWLVVGAKKLLQIYSLDNIYCLSRALGLLVSIFHDPYKR